MFAPPDAARWSPSWSLIIVLAAVSLFLAALTAAAVTVRAPRLLGYRVGATPHAGWWSITAVQFGSFAWDAGLRPGQFVRAARRPSTEGNVSLQMLSQGRPRRVVVPRRGESDPRFAWLELLLAGA